MTTQRLTSRSGLVTVVEHRDMPGVLVRMETDAPVVHGRVMRSVEGRAWEPVRSGDYARFIARDDGIRVGHAFDLAAVPGRRTAYTVDLGDELDPDHVVSIELRPILGNEAWLKHGAHPDLSRAVQLVDDGTPFVTGGVVDQVGVYGAGRPYLVQAGTSGVSTTLKLWCEGEADVRGVRALVTTPGPLLLQTPDSYGLDEMWLAWTGDAVTEDHYSGHGWAYRLLTVPVVEVDPPATLWAPLVTPGANYATMSRDARTWADYAAQYGTSTGALMAAIGADRVDT